MVNALAGFPRHTPEAMFSSPAAFDAAYPVTNCGVLPFARVARTLVTQDLTITAQFSERQLIELVVLSRHNVLTNDARWRVRLYEDAAGTVLLHDSGWLDIWPATKTEAQVTWDSGNWWDRSYTAKEKRGYPFYAPHFVPGLLYGQRVDVSISAPSHQGPLDIGLIEIASALEFPVNPEVGASYGLRGRSRAVEAEGGVEYFQRRTPARVFTGQLPYLPSGDAKATFFEFMRQADISEPFFWWPNRDDALHTLRDAFMARHEELGLITYATPFLQTVPISYKELL